MRIPATMTGNGKTIELESSNSILQSELAFDANFTICRPKYGQDASFKSSYFENSTTIHEKRANTSYTTVRAGGYSQRGDFGRGRRPRGRKHGYKGSSRHANTNYEVTTSNDYAALDTEPTLDMVNAGGHNTPTLHPRNMDNIIEEDDKSHDSDGSTDEADKSDEDKSEADAVDNAQSDKVKSN